MPSWVTFDGGNREWNGLLRSTCSREKTCYLPQRRRVVRGYLEDPFQRCDSIINSPCPFQRVAKAG